MTRATTILAAVLFVSAVYATAEVVHHAGLNFFERAMPDGPGSISLRSTEPLRVSSAHAVTIPIAGEL